MGGRVLGACVSACLVASTLACEPSRPPAAPAPPVEASGEEEEDASFLRSEKLDEDVQELVVRAFGADAAFTFELRTSRPLDPITWERFAEHGVEIVASPEGRSPHVRARASALGVVTGDERVRRVTCAAPPAPEEAPDEDAFRGKLERDVRLVVGAKSTCWFEVTIRFGKEPPEGERAFYEAHGALVTAWSADDAIAWVPVRFLPHVAARESVAFVEVRRNFR